MNFPNKKYQIIYADPPWSYQYSGSRHHGDAKTRYETMGIKEICNLPVNEISESQSVCLMWVTFPQLAEGLQVMKAWGFKYKTVAFTWVKLQRQYAKKGKPMLYNERDFRTGTGYFTNSNAEIVLLGTKGKNLERQSKNVKQIVIEPIIRHSEKPHEVRERIIDLYGDLPRIELFARQTVKGWDSWGNEINTENEQCEVI